MEAVTINEIFLKSIQSRATPSCQSRAPLSTISENTNINIGNTVNWKCLARSIPRTDVIMVKAVGSKRSARHTRGQFELQKKKKIVSQDGKGNNLILAEAGSQPYQKQRVFYVGTIEGLGTNIQKISLQS